MCLYNLRKNWGFFSLEKWHLILIKLQLTLKNANLTSLRKCESYVSDVNVWVKRRPQSCANLLTDYGQMLIPTFTHIFLVPVPSSFLCLGYADSLFWFWNAFSSLDSGSASNYFEFQNRKRKKKKKERWRCEVKCRISRTDVDARANVKSRLKCSLNASAN